jgi:hypothetical protein
MMIYGPICPGCHLTTVPIELENGAIDLAKDNLPQF